MNPIRQHYVHQLETLRDDLLAMGNTVEVALQQALKSLQTWDETLATQVIQSDARIDLIQHQLEERAIVLMATQQPVASDLRLVGSIYAMVSELERIGDYAKHVARRLRRVLKRSVLVTPPPDLFDMSAIAQKMLRTSLDAFLDQDTDKAQGMTDDYERIGAFETNLRKELVALAQTHPERIESILDLLDVVHALARISARTINIAERIIYIETNTMEDLRA
jgi:phosphate transport system protein